MSSSLRPKRMARIRVAIATIDASGLALLGDAEAQPYLHVFALRHIAWSAYAVKRLELPAVAAEQPTFADLSWTVPDDAPVDVRSDEACIGFSLFCRTLVRDESSGVDYGYVRREPLGSGVAYVHDLLSLAAHRQEVQVALLDRSNQGAEPRAILSVRLDRAIEGVTFSTAAPPSATERARRARLASAPIERFMQAYEAGGGRFVPSVPQAWNMHIPTWTTNTGPIPAAFFLAAKPVQAPDATVLRYFVQTAIALQGWTEHEFLAVLRRQMSVGVDATTYDRRFNLVAKVFGDALTFTANCADYGGDHSARESVERFKFSRISLYLADCEDDGKEIELVAHSISIVARVATSIEVEERDDALLYHVSRLARLYVFSMTTALAMTPSALKGQPPGSPEDDATEYICHIYTNGVPRWNLVQRLEISSEQRLRVIESMSRDAPIARWEQELPMLVLEGTNWSTPLQRPLHLYAAESEQATVVAEQLRIERARAALERDSVGLRSLGVQIQQSNIGAASVSELSQERFSGFYRWVVDAWIDLRRHGITDVLDFTVAYPPADGGTAGPYRYGADFRDWVEMRESVRFVPTYRLAPEETAEIEQVLAKIHPVPEIVGPLVLPEQTDAMRELRALCAKHPMRSEEQRTAFVPPYILYRLNHQNKLTREVLDALAETIRAGRVRGIACGMHAASADGELYLVEIRLDVSERQ